MRAMIKMCPGILYALKYKHNRYTGLQKKKKNPFITEYKF